VRAAKDARKADADAAGVAGVDAATETGLAVARIAASLTIPPLKTAATIVNARTTTAPGRQTSSRTRPKATQIAAKTRPDLFGPARTATVIGAAGAAGVDVAVAAGAADATGNRAATALNPRPMQPMATSLGRM
jgi:hypothetical protein